MQIMQSTDVETRSFRLRCAHMWLWAGIAHLGLTALCLLAVHLAALAVDPLWVVVMCIMPCFYWVVYGLKYRLRVSASGLGWVNLSGADCFLPWQDIEKADQIKEIGFPVLRVWSKREGGPFLIPLFVTERDLLPDAVKETAGSAHPVTVAVAACDPRSV
jgi:hypothetical protein